MWILVIRSKLNSDLMTVQVLYGISFLGFVMKLLHYLVIFEKIGNKVLVLKETAWDVIVFGILFVTFALSYGVLMQTTLYPNEWRADKIWDGILFKSFFHVYGELFLGKQQRCTVQSVLSDRSDKLHFSNTEVGRTTEFLSLPCLICCSKQQ